MLFDNLFHTYFSLKYLLSCLILIFIFSGCKKEINDDVSFVKTAATSAKLGAMFTITQDNTGLVTIIPNGEGVASFEVTYGHGTNTPVKVLPGGNTTHIYPEGIYDVKITGTNVAGVATTVTQKLTVTFKAPVDEEVDTVASVTDKAELNVLPPAKVCVPVETTPLALDPASGKLNVCVDVTDDTAKSVPDVPV